MVEGAEPNRCGDPRAEGRRSVFVVPWGGTDGDFEFTYIGTTDTDYDGSLDDPQCEPADIEYLLKAINFSVTSPLTEADILGTWAGLRPLVKSATSGRTADLSAATVWRDPTATSSRSRAASSRRNREMAADTVDEVVDVLGKDATRHASRKSRTKRLHLRGADGYESTRASAGDDATLLHLLDRYGDEARSVLALADADPRCGHRWCRGSPTSGPRPSTPRATRWHGRSTTC